MADGLDTGIPPWLSHNWQPRETFDPTPWLQERYRRNVQAQTLPLQIQSMALQNQAQSLAIEHQGMLNDVQGMQLQQYQSEAPRLQELIKQYATDPVGMMNHVESFQSPVVQKQWIDAQVQAAKTQAGLAAVEGMKQKWVAASRLLDSPGNIPPMETDPRTGAPSDAWLSQAAAAKQEAVQKLWSLRVGWHYDEFGNPIAGGGAGGLSAAGKNDALITDYETKRDAALAAGDTAAAQRAQDHINFIKSSHRNPLVEARLSSLKSEKAKVFELMSMSKPGSDTYNRYKASYDDLQQQMEKAAKEGEGLPATTPAASEPAQTMDIGRFKVQVK